MYSIMRATSFSVFNCKVFLPSLNKVIYFIYLLSQKKNRQIPQYRKTSKTLSKINEITKLLPCIILKLRAYINS